MSVTNTSTKSALTLGNGATTAFSTVFHFNANSEVKVYKILVSTGAETLQTETTHYTLTGAGTGAAGTITFLTAPTSSYYVQAFRDTALTQETDYVAGTKFNADTHENALDKLTRITQELDGALDRAVQLPKSSTLYPVAFPDGGASKAGYVIRWDETTGTTLEAVTPTEAALTASLTPTDGGFVVGDGTGFVIETGATARTSLGLGTMSTQAASAVAITGGTVTGITDITVADGGTGASTASDARTNLGLAIGTDVQAYDSELAALAGLTSAADKAPYFTGSGTAALMDVSAAARTVLDDASTSAMRTTLGLAIGTDVQAYDAELAAIAGLTSAANKGITFTGVGTASTYDLSAAALTVLDDATVSAMVDTLGGAAAQGSGAIVRATSPTLTTPVLGVATGTSFNGLVPTAATTTVGADIALAEGTNNGTNVFKLKAADSMAASYTLEMPAAVPAGNGYTLSVTTGGVATWIAPGAAGAGGANTNVQFNSSGALGGDANFTYDGAGTAFVGTGINLGHATDTTLTRASAGDINIEGNIVYRAAGTDVPVTDGGTGLSTFTTAYGVVCAGTTAAGALQNAGTGTSGQAFISNGAAALPAWTTILASQSDQETATSTTTYVSPGRQQFHPGHPKVWCRMDGTGTAAITSSYNMTSITDNGTGDFTFTIATDFSGTTWCPFFHGTQIFNNTNRGTKTIGIVATPTAGDIRIECWDSGAANEDWACVTMLGLGDQ